MPLKCLKFSQMSGKTSGTAAQIAARFLYVHGFDYQYGN